MLISDTKQDLSRQQKDRQFMGISIKGLENLEAVTQERVALWVYYAASPPFFTISNQICDVQPNYALRSLAEYYIYKADICL